MKPLALALHAPQTMLTLFPHSKSLLQNRRFSPAFCSSVSSETIQIQRSKLEYKKGILDDFFLDFFRNKLSFFKDYVGVPLVMEPNFNDYSCQFKFGVNPPLPENDDTLKQPCLDICPIANKRRVIQKNVDVMTCPKA
ncbi:putative Tetratricopeptide repeat (TPR)-like superfamily protein [Hibiscus syriacus]|uniref:Tetratricopeptide repeat (TPR)-like superfamily protein n=1 Tax=Hibiscus syriacus TaxID=106335 RepID=A0A6A3A1P9_HIBSY|nr:putative Tetratricopeptide repeat (TPR)-like superfamily protein [Hibiscus syriacus]